MPSPLMPSNRIATSEVREQESITSLLRRLTDELLTLFRQEMALATAEISRTISGFLSGIASIAVGGAVLYAGLLVLLAAAVIGLAHVVSDWLAALIVGVVTVLIGAMLLLIGGKKIQREDLKPQKTVDSLRQDKDVLTRRDR
jgi:hypothetical protein